MRIPKSLKIRRSKWSVKITKDRKVMDIDKFLGLCYPEAHKILLNGLESRNAIEQTFVHELLHACWPNGECSDRLEERIIDKLSKTLYEALSKNKMLK